MTLSLVRRSGYTTCGWSALRITTPSASSTISSLLAKKVKSVLGVDIKKECVEHCKATIKSKKARFIVSDLFDKVPKKYQKMYEKPPLKELLYRPNVPKGHKPSQKNVRNYYAAVTGIDIGSLRATKEYLSRSVVRKYPDHHDRRHANPQPNRIR